MILMKSILLYQFILLFVYILYKLLLLKFSRNNHFCISLIIPSTLEDIIRCFSTLKRSICNSQKLPYEVILVVSGVLSKNNTYISLLSQELRKCTYKLNVIYRRRKYNAASNRNQGYYKSSCSIISFFDVDDIMSIYRIYVIYRTFDENRNVDVLFHPSTRNIYKLDSYNLSNLYTKYVDTNQFHKITERCRNTFTFDNRIYKCDVSNKFFITNGWPSLKRNIMNYIRFNESLQSTEDLDFISRIVEKGYNVALFKMPLGFYIKDFSCTF